VPDKQGKHSGIRASLPPFEEWLSPDCRHWAAIGSSSCAQAFFLQLGDSEILQDAGKVTAELAKSHSESEFEKYRIVQDRLFESDFDKIIKTLPPTEGDSA